MIEATNYRIAGSPDFLNFQFLPQHFSTVKSNPNCYKGSMNTATLLADPAAIKPTYIRSAADSITIVVKAILPHSSCPLCDRPLSC